MNKMSKKMANYRVPRLLLREKAWWAGAHDVYWSVLVSVVNAAHNKIVLTL
jgi:hypothetical protein